MNMLHVKYAMEIAKAGSLNKAAENLYMGQPNLSRALKELEASLGIAIFDRSPKGMVLTSEGAEFLKSAERVIKEIEAIEAKYGSAGTPVRRFSLSAPRADYISKAFADFAAAAVSDKNSELIYRECGAMEAIKNVIENDTHLGVVRYAKAYDGQFKEYMDERGLRYEIVAEFGRVLTVSEKSPLAAADIISPHDLQNYTEIAYPDIFVPSLPSGEVKKEELCQEAKNRIIVCDRDTKYRLLSENRAAFSFDDPLVCDTPPRFGLVQKKFGGRIYKDVFIYRRDYHLTKDDNAFITALCDAKRKYM